VTVEISFFPSLQFHYVTSLREMARGPLRCFVLTDTTSHVFHCSLLRSYYQPKSNLWFV